MSDRQKQVKSFLKNISKIESSDGKNFDHPEIQTGIQKGTKAIGRYGLMPNTVHEVINRMRRSGITDPQIERLKDLDPDTLKNTLEGDPELEDRIAEKLADRVLTRQQDEDKAAYTWHQGHNMSSADVEKNPYKDNDYVKKYNKYKEEDGNVDE